MPRPDTGNEEAAAFVEYYASPRMVHSAVNRLYYGGVESKKRAEAKAAEEAYPSIQSTRRSRAELEAYLHDRVQGELLRRQQHRVALQQELYPEPESPPKYLSEKEMMHHIKHVYDEPLKVRRAREAELRRIFGADKDAAEVMKETVYQYYPLPTSSARTSAAPSSGPPSVAAGASVARSPSRQGRKGRINIVTEHYRALEKGWRPPSASMSHDDHRRLLVSQYDYYADPHKYTELTLKSRPLTEKEKLANQKRLELLSRPTRVNPPVVHIEESNDPPPFRVSRKVQD